jgi:cytochrome c-type biogenesis protein CcmH
LGVDNWGFWVAAAAMCLAVAASLIATMFQRREPGPSAAAFDVQVYRAQLAEVERDVASGAVSSSDAERLRVEISRRILEADRAGRGVVAGSGVSTTALGSAGLVIAVVIVGAVWGYLRLGAPGYPDVPLKARLAAAEDFHKARPTQAAAEAVAPVVESITPDAVMADLMVKLRQAVAGRPGDIQGLTLLARNEAALGNLAAARTAQVALVAAKGAAVTGDDHAALAEILIRLAGGYVSPEAEAELISALKLEPENGLALYYSGLMFAQGDRADRAFSLWSNLLKASAPDAPWVAPIRAQIEEVAARAGVRYELPDVVGPSAADVAAAADMTPEDRRAMIESMVAGLSDRLAKEGGPAEDWARLITSLGVLGDKARASAVYVEARGHFAGDTVELQGLRDAAVAAGITP